MNPPPLSIISLMEDNEKEPHWDGKNKGITAQKEGVPCSLINYGYFGLASQSIAGRIALSTGRYLVQCVGISVQEPVSTESLI